MAQPSKLLSPLSLVLSAIFFLSTNVLATPAALGVDLGTEYIKASLVKPGIPLEIVLTKDSRRKETTAVTFKPNRDGVQANAFPERFYGSDAMALAPRFPADVYPNLKHILGLPLDHSIVQDYAARYPGLQLEADQLRGTAALKSKAFVEEEEAWMVEELLAMELQNIRKNAEAATGDGSTVRSVVLTVPPYFTTEEKRALELAADLAGLKVLSLVSDGMAVGLHYATSRQFPNIDEGAQPEYHLVFDIGAGSASATVMKFQSRSVKDVGKYNKTVQEIRMLGSTWDRSLGGDALNSLIVDDMVAQFVQSPGAKQVSATPEQIKKHGRAMAKLNRDAEKVRHILSANSNTQASIESLYEDVDFKYTITRDHFEAMAASHAETIATIVKDALTLAEIEVSDLTSAILNGGTTRTPFVQKALADSLGSTEKIRTSVNSDEAAVMGAAFKAADLSPGFRVKDIKTFESANYAAGLKWTNAKDKVQRQKLWNPSSHLGSVPKQVTLPNHEDHSLIFYQLVGDAERDINVLTTKNLTASVAELKEKYACDDAGISFKLGLKLSPLNGEVVVDKASVECEGEVAEKDTIMDGVKNLFGFGKKDQQPLDGEEGANADSNDASPSEGAEAEPSTSSAAAESEASEAASATTASDEAETPTTDEKVTKKQLVTIPVDFALEDAGIPTLPKDRLKKLKDRLKAFDASDKARLLQEEALNQLEGYTYKVRDLLDGEAFIAASTEAERNTLQEKLSETSEWVSEDGTDAPREELQKRHKELKKLVEPVQKRVSEAEERPTVLKELKEALEQTATFLETARKQIKDYDDWHSSASAASTEESSSTVTEAPSADAGEFDGLEDDEAVTTTDAPTMEDVLQDRGPVPPLYKEEDLGVVDKLAQEVTAWLAELEPRQETLPATADPVLLVKEMRSRREKLDKAGMDLAMKGVKNFEATKKKAEAEKAKAKGKDKAKDKAKDGKGKAEAPTQEEIEEMLRKIKEDEEQEKGDKKPEHDEL